MSSSACNRSPTALPDHLHSLGAPPYQKRRPQSSPTPPLDETPTVVTSSNGSSPYGQSAMFTATVTPSSGSGPTGTVQFQIDGSNVGSPVALDGSTAAYSTSTLAVGGHSVVAIYSGDGNFSGSPSSGCAVGREHDPIVGLGRGPVGYRVARQPAARRRSPQSLGLPRMTSPSDSLPCIIPRDIESPICVGLNSLQIEKDVCDACRLALPIFHGEKKPFPEKARTAHWDGRKGELPRVGNCWFVARWLGRVQECLRASYSVATE